jgi:hypothetical protein
MYFSAPFACLATSFKIIRLVLGRLRQLGPAFVGGRAPAAALKFWTALYGCIHNFNEPTVSDNATAKVHRHVRAKQFRIPSMKRGRTHDHTMHLRAKEANSA